jgi:hypothetical protein
VAGILPIRGETVLRAISQSAIDKSMSKQIDTLPYAATVAISKPLFYCP